MNMIMFTPMNGRRSLMMKKRDTKLLDFCEGLDAQLSQIAMEGIRFYIMYENNRQMDTKKYYESQVVSKFDSEIFRLIMKHIIDGVTTKLIKTSINDGMGQY